MNIYIGNLSWDARDDDLRELFEQYGTVDSAKVIIDRHRNRSKGFGFVEMGNDDEAQAAIDALDGSTFMERDNLKVNKARPRSEKPDRGRGGGGYNSNRSW